MGMEESLRASTAKLKSPKAVTSLESRARRPAAEQVNSWGGGGGANMQTHPTRGVWGHAPPGKFSNLRD